LAQYKRAPGVIFGWFICWSLFWVHSPTHTS